MSQFCYFVPSDTRKLNPRAIEIRNLPERLRSIFRDTPPAARDAKFHDGRNGVLLSAEARYARLDSANQCWQASECGEYHVGWWRDHVPPIEGLLRPRPLDGDYLELPDGRRLLIPILHGDYLTIPQAEGYGPNGKVQLFAIPGYDVLLAKSASYYEQASTGQISRDATAWREFFTLLVGVNYRVNIEEIWATRLLYNSVAEVCKTLSVCLGFTAMRAEVDAQKKTSTPPDGSEDSAAA